jgi:transposase
MQAGQLAEVGVNLDPGAVEAPLVMRRMSEERRRPCGLLVGIKGASNAHSASLRSLEYTGNATPKMTSEICVRYTFRVGYLRASFPSFSSFQALTKWCIRHIRGKMRHLEGRCLMGKRLQLREVATDEQQALARLAHSRTAPAGRVKRAQVVLAAVQGMAVEEIAAQHHVVRNTVYLWLHRFEEHGVAGLKDAARNGRPPLYTREQVSEIIATALTPPQTLGLPFSSWTLDRLVAYLAEQHGIMMQRSRLDEVLLSEGLRWRKHETWFGERADPDFAQKRGRSSSSTRHRPQGAS